MPFERATALGLAFCIFGCQSQEPSAGPAPATTQRSNSTRATSGVEGARMGPELEHVADEVFAAEHEKIAGFVVLVARGNRVLVSKAYGWADIANRRALSLSNVFRIASLTKQFTAAAVLRLVELGKLRTDDPLSKYVPEFPEPGRRVTVAQLLSHTSGIPAHTDLPWFATHRQDSITPADLIGLIGKEPLSFEPGTQFRYSNSGYWLLGLIIERASGEAYADFLQEAVLSRAGLTQTRYCPDAQDYPAAALGYELIGSRPVLAPRISMTMPFAAGSLCSTAGDLVRWSQALRSGVVISAENSARMRQPTLLPNGTRSSYGFGLGFDDSRGTHMEGHSGSIPGFMADLYYLPGQDIDIAVLVNTLRPGGFPLTARLVEAILTSR
jgi:D-alanyl-D-alanine carboxypeptidase